MKRSLWRPLAAISILVITVAAFIDYFAKHPEAWQQLKQTSPATLTTILLLYIVGIVALAFVTIATLRLCKIRLRTSESLLLTMYAAIVNFFGPLQSGPAFRAVYLKKKHNLSLKHYGVATLVYYCFYGGFNVALLLSGVLKWWLIPLIGGGLLCVFAASQHKRLKPRLQELDLTGWYYLALATLAQIVVVTLIYYTELRSVSPGVHFSQAIIYTGAANLSLFVSLTPGAIGFRESFLLFSQHLHHISNSAIIAANTIDRAMYLVLLLLLALFIFVTHTRQQLGITKDE